MTTSAGTKVVPTKFEKELEHLINCNCMENASNTPDYMLAQFLCSCLLAFNTATQQRETWYGRDARPNATITGDRSAPAEIERLSVALVDADSSIDFQQQRGRHADIIGEAIAEYDSYMLDDDYDADRALTKIIVRMRERLAMTAPVDAGSAEPVAVIIDSQFADFGDNRIRAIKLSLGVNLYDDDELYARPPAPKTAWIDAATVERNSRPPALKVSDEKVREIWLIHSFLIDKHTVMNYAHFVAAVKALELAGRQ